ncbi:hypothetical protein MTP99_019609 [Tenebrio molitor]|nr:hypothetical protein MTP99_019609 [Tenebrio molitor]
MVVSTSRSMNVFLLLSLLLLVVEEAALEVQNIRHGRSRTRLLRGRRHGEDSSVDKSGFGRGTEGPFGENVSLSGKNRTNLSPEEGQSNATKSGRKVTVGSNLGNSSWQHVDKSMLYMGERALNHIDSKKKNKSSGGSERESKKGSPGESQGHDVNAHGSFVEGDFDEEVEISSEKAATESARSGHVDIVTRFLRIVESQHLLGENCTAGTDLNLGEGVVDRYAQERFRVEADVAVNRANMLTRIWKYADPEVVMSEYLLHASVFSMVEFDNDIFAAGNCYDQYQYKDYWLFCPYAYRLPEGTILVKDLAVEYKYLSNTSEWFYIARKNAENVIKNYNQFSRERILEPGKERSDERYVRKQKLEVNVEKTKMIVFNKRKRKREENEWNSEVRKIEQVNEFKYLGYTFNERPTDKRESGEVISGGD